MRMTSKQMKAFALLAGLAACGPQAAAAAEGTSRVGPIVDLPLAALVGARDPNLAPAQREALTTLADGKSVSRADAIEVTAQAVTCRESDVAIAERSCELTFGAHKMTLSGLEAHEMAATLKEAGASSEGAAGSIFTGLTDLRCRVSPLQVLAKAGGGASCSFALAK